MSRTPPSCCSPITPWSATTARQTTTARCRIWRLTSGSRPSEWRGFAACRARVLPTLSGRARSPLRSASRADATAAAPGLLIGFLDQFVPAIIAGGISSPVTSFVLAGLSVTQLIFMAETGVLIHRSKIPLPIRYLASVFLIRTAIALPILVMIAHWINN